MNVELKRRATSSSVPAPVLANDNAERREYAQSRRSAIIHQPARSAMTSGRAATKRWLLEFEPQSAPFTEPLMGWTGSTDPMTEVWLSFPSREAAVAYAQRQGLAYEVREMAGQAKSCATAAKPESDAMPLWSMPLLESEWNDLLIAEAGPTGLALDLAD